MFNVPFEPTIGDTFDLADAPEVTYDEFDSSNEAHLRALRVLQAFIRRAIPEDERPRYDKGWYRIPMSEQAVILEIAAWVTEQWTTFPTTPPASSSPGQDASGMTSNVSVDGGHL